MKAVLSYQYIERNVCEKLDPYICQERERKRSIRVRKYHKNSLHEPHKQSKYALSFLKV